MPGKRKRDKVLMGVWLTAELYVKFRKLAAQLDMTMSEIVTAYIVARTAEIILTPEDYEEIADRIRRNHH